MSESMDKLVKSGDVREIDKVSFNELKKKHGYVPAYEFLGTEEAKENGLHPLKKIVPIENWCYQLPESYEDTFAEIWAFSYFGKYYVFSFCG